MVSIETKLISYDVEKSAERMDNIIKESDSSFEELDSIPARSKLTFTNGFYVNCSALFVDIRDSSKLPEKHTRPKLAKLYRVYISEIVAFMNSFSNCKEVMIEGDCVWGIFDTPYLADINTTFACAFGINSVVQIMNYKFKKKQIEQIRIGIGVSYGRALMAKAGYSGSTINEAVWMGDVVNDAAKLCSYGNKLWNDRSIMVSECFYNNLNEHNKDLLAWNANRSCYHGDVVDAGLEKWYQDNCK